LTDRSSGTISNVNNAETFEEYKKHIDEANARYKAKKASVTPPNGIGHNYQLQMQSKPEAETTDLDKAFGELETVMDLLKEAVVSVAQKLVKIKLAESKAETDKEIAALKKELADHRVVVEAAKDQSIAGMLKRQFMGN